MGPQKVKVPSASGSPTSKLHDSTGQALAQAGAPEGSTLDRNRSNTENADENSLLASYYMGNYFAR